MGAYINASIVIDAYISKSRMNLNLKHGEWKEEVQAYLNLDYFNIREDENYIYFKLKDGILTKESFLALINEQIAITKNRKMQQLYDNLQNVDDIEEIKKIADDNRFEMLYLGEHKYYTDYRFHKLAISFNALSYFVDSTKCDLEGIGATLDYFEAVIKNSSNSSLKDLIKVFIA